MENYEVKILRASKELTAMEKIAIKDTSDCVGLDMFCDNGAAILHPTMWVEIGVNNPYSKGEKEYTKFVVVDSDGTKYTTGSKSFISSFLNIYEELEKEGITGYGIKVFKMESKNYKGKSFITCTLAL